jgi:hypothetical protein
MSFKCVDPGKNQSNFENRPKSTIFASAYRISNVLKRHYIPKIYCGVEQLVARWAHNPKVVGSSPTPATTRNPVSVLRKLGFLLSPIESLEALTLGGITNLI